MDTGAFPVALPLARAVQTQTCTAGTRRPVGGVAKNSGSGPHPPGPTNGPGHGSSIRVHPSLLPPTLWMSPTNLPLAPDLGP